MTKDEKKKGVLGKVLDAVSSRDEKEALQQAEHEAKTMRSKAEHEAMRRQAAEEVASVAKQTASQARAQAQAAQAAAATAKAKAARLEHKLEAQKRRVERGEMRAERQREREQKAAEQAQTYVVKSGDSLSKIAKELLGDAGRWPEILELNKDQITNPSLIRVGQEFKIPTK